MSRTGGKLPIVSGRGIGLVLAFVWVLLEAHSVVRAGMPDGGAAGRPGGARWACPTLGACLAALKALPATDGPDEVTDDRERAIASSLRGYGKAAIPDLLRLVASRQAEARKMAAYTLSEIDGLTPADLPPLLRALHAGEHGAVALAVAAIGTPEAIAALYAALKAHPEDWQLPFAVARLGHAGVPTLMEAFDCRDGTSDPSTVRAPCAPPLLAAVAGIFGKLGPEASDAVPHLFQIAQDKRHSVPLRRAAIDALGAIGPGAASTASALQEIARAEPAPFGEVVENALFGMKVPAAGKILAAQLTGAPTDHLVLRDLAQLGTGGQPAAKQAIGLLRNPDWRVRVAAARALGYFGDREAVAPLLMVLDNPENWQLSYAAAESLGRLGDARADGALAALERNHWYPPVRESARKARAAIAARERYVSRWEPANFPFEFYEFENAGRDVKPCHPGSRYPRQPFLPDDDLRRALADKMTYDAGTVGYDPGPYMVVPNAALQVADGWLLGRDHGEFGGELVFVDHAGRATSLVDDNIDGVARLGSRVVAVGGLAHLGGNRGLAYEVARDAKGRWSAHLWRVLPGAPWGAALQPDGSWMIDTNSGTILLAPDGGIRMATCPAR